MTYRSLNWIEYTPPKSGNAKSGTETLKQSTTERLSEDISEHTISGTVGEGQTDRSTNNHVSVDVKKTNQKTQEGTLSQNFSCVGEESQGSQGIDAHVHQEIARDST